MSSVDHHGRPVERETPDVNRERVDWLVQLFPECVTEGKIDFDKLRLALGDEIDDRPERYTFSWAGKRDAIRVLQAPSRATLVPCPEESIDFKNTQNLFIEGDNLEVLKLLFKPYFGRVKMIYIDPPYNTGNDFVYRDNYADPLDSYLKLTGQKASNGDILTSNPETSGRFHSTWLSMIYPRLFLARQLLSDDGVVVVSIDDHEVSNLRLLMEEVFGSDNFVGQITVQSNPRGRQAERFFATVHEYLLVFAKNVDDCILGGAALTENQLKEFKYEDHAGRKYRLLGLRQRGSASLRSQRPQMYYPLYVQPSTASVSTEPTPGYDIEVLPMKPTGEEGRWMWSKNKVHADLSIVEAHLVAGRNEWDIFVRDYLDLESGETRTRKFKTIWAEKKLNYQNGTEEVKALLGGPAYEYPKPTALLKQVLAIADESDALCLDFFAGSCTTAHAVMALNREDGANRRFIMVQLPEPTPEDSPARQMGLNTIAEIGKERIRRVIKRMKDEAAQKLDLTDSETPEDLGFKVFKLAESNFRPWTPPEQTDPEAYIAQMELMVDPLVEGWTPENVITEVAIKEGYGLNAVIQRLEALDTNTIYRVTDPDKEQSFFICLDDKIDPATPRALCPAKDDLFVCRDVALTDEMAANLALQCNLKTI